MSERRGRVLPAYATLVYVFLYLPIFILLVKSVDASGLTGFPPRGFTLEWYRRFFANQAAVDGLVQSAQIALLVAGISPILGFLAAFGLTRYAFVGKRIFETCLYLPIVIPYIVTAIAMALTFSQFGIRLSFGTVVLGHVIVTLPFVTLIIATSLSGFDRTLEEAAQDLGANEWATFRKVLLPNIMPGIVSAVLMAFTLSFDEFILTYFLRGIRIETLPIWLWNEIKFGVTSEINAIASLVLLFSMGLITVAELLRRKGIRT